MAGLLQPACPRRVSFRLGARDDATHPRMMTSSAPAPRDMEPTRRRVLLWGGAILVSLGVVGALLFATYRNLQAEWLKNGATADIVAGARGAPRDPDLAYAAALRLSNENRLSEAEPFARRAAALRPVSAAPQLLLGQVHERAGRPLEALIAFERACRLDPGLEAAHEGAGLLYERAQLWPEAISHLRTAWERNIPDSDVRLAMVEALLQTRDYAGAEKEAREIIEFGPAGTATPFVLLHRALEGQGKPRQGEHELRNHLRRLGDRAPAHFLAALCLMILESDPNSARLADAEDHARRAMRRDPEDLLAREAMAACLWRKGQYAPAGEHLRAVVECEPRNGRARIQLGRVLRGLGREGEAVRVEPPVPDARRARQLTLLREQAESPPAEPGLRLSLADEILIAGDPAFSFRLAWPLAAKEPPAAGARGLASRCLAALLARPVMA